MSSVARERRNGGGRERKEGDAKEMSDVLSEMSESRLHQRADVQDGVYIKAVILSLRTRVVSFWKLISQLHIRHSAQKSNPHLMERRGEERL